MQWLEQLQMKKVGWLLLSGRAVSERFATRHMAPGTALHLSKRQQTSLKAMNCCSLIQHICPTQWLSPLTVNLRGCISLPDSSKRHTTAKKMVNVPFPATLIQDKPRERIWSNSNFPHHIRITSVTPCAQTELVLEAPILLFKDSGLNGSFPCTSLSFGSLPCMQIQNTS